MRISVPLLLLGWLAAFLIVMALFVAFGEQLEDLPLALRALAISGVLSVSMTLVVMPMLARLLRRTGGTGSQR